MSLQDIVNVQITRGTKTVSRAGFGTALLLADNFTPSEVRSYSNYAAVLADTDVPVAAKAAAQAYFAQELKPQKLKIAKRTTKVAGVTTITPVVAGVVTASHFVVTIDGVDYDFLSAANPTAAQVVTGLSALINADPNALVTASGTVTLILTEDNAGGGSAVSVGDHLTLVNTTASVGVVTDMQAATALDSDWYCLLLTSRNAVDILAAAMFIEAGRKMFAACSADAAVVTNVTTDIGSQLKQRGLLRTYLLWNEGQSSYPEAGWAGGVLPMDPGSETWKFKSIALAVPSVLTDTKEGYLKAKNVNYYVEFGGVKMTTEGITAGGEFIDVIRFIDWLAARMTERVFARLVSLPKVPFTDTGVSQIEGDMRAVLEQGINVGGLSNDPAPYVDVPKVADVDPQERARRTLPDLKFGGTLAGAIHAAEIAGVVSV